VTALLCPRCQRANPSEAAFCHFDGAELRAGVASAEAAGSARLPHEFVFPSGRRCKTYDDLVLGCQAEWEVARDLLRQGVFRKFLVAAGRMDLARTAQETKAVSDPDIALDTFLACLPASPQQRPRLELSPRRLNLGILPIGETRQVRLMVSNAGKGVLHGTLTIDEGNGWLRLADGKNNGECQIKTAREQQIVLRIDTRGLIAPNKQSAKLTVVTNGGIVEVPVRLDLAVQPFNRPPFQGVGSPREMAEKMRLHPKAAAPLLESGDVANWFARNGWTYPVLEPTAKGVAAVQQFFEGMGLSKPPTLRLSENEITLSATNGEPLHGQFVVRTDAKKWVYARAESDVRWLRLPAASVSGPQQAAIAFEADPEQLESGGTHEGSVRIVGNAGQSLIVRVRVRSERAEKAQPPHQTNPFVVGATAALLLRLLLAVPADLYARGHAAATSNAVLAEPTFVRSFMLATWWIGAVVGALYLWRSGSRKIDAVFGMIAGAVFGFIGSATFAFMLPAVDRLPRLLWGGSITTLWLARPLWIALAVLTWTLLGGVLGVVISIAGGGELLRSVSGMLSRLARVCGFRRTAQYFAS
jgi:Family of unknown function (DUF5717)N-terminal